MKAKRSRASVAAFLAGLCTDLKLMNPSHGPREGTMGMRETPSRTGAESGQAHHQTTSTEQRSRTVGEADSNSSRVIRFTPIGCGRTYTVIYTHTIAVIHR